MGDNKIRPEPLVGQLSQKVRQSSAAPDMVDELLKGGVLGWFERRQLAVCEIADAREIGPVDRALSYGNHMPAFTLRECQREVLELTGEVLVNEKHIHARLPNAGRQAGGSIVTATRMMSRFLLMSL
jgi:hypothetical protein